MIKGKELLEKREKYNQLIIDYINYKLNNSQIRFNQLMYIINETKDYFNEEPWETWERIKGKFNDALYFKK
jgi:hypothetical protein